MHYPEFLPLIENGTVAEGASVWVVDFRHNDIMNKPIRNVPPTEVRLVSSDEAPNGKRISGGGGVHFRAYSKNGNLSSKVINPFDNTAWSGGEINVFFTEQEANDFYRVQCNKVADQVLEAQRQSNARFNNMLTDVTTRLNSIK